VGEFAADKYGAMANYMAELSIKDLRQITHSLLLEWVSDVAISDRGTFVDLDVISSSALGLQHRQRFRLLPHPVTILELQQLQREAAAIGRNRIAVASLGLEQEVEVPPGITTINAEMFDRLCQESGVIVRDEQSRYRIDRTALRELKDQTDARFSFINGLLWLRPLSRNRVPPALRWTGRPAHELFERYFFLTMTTTFRATGTSWGTKKRGKPIPDGVLNLPQVGTPVLYDCKATHNGYEMTYRDLTGFADYLRHPPEGGWSSREEIVPHFLVISSQIQGGTRQASFQERQRALNQKVPGAKLIWMRASDLVRFGLAIEAAEVAPADREGISWATLLDTGDVHWDVFQAELGKLTQLGYTFPEDG
jgi:hypothetical protein